MILVTPVYVVVGVLRSRSRWQSKGGAAPQFHAKARQDLPPLFRLSEVPREVRPENLNNQLQTSQLQTALKGTTHIVARSISS